MLSGQVKELLRTAGIVSRRPVTDVLGCIAAVLLPALFLACGSVIDVLAAPASPRSRDFGWFIPNLRLAFSNQFSPLAEVALLLLIALIVVLINAGCLLLFYRRIQSASVGFESSIIRQMRNHSRRLAVSRSLSGQETALSDGLEYHLPRVRSSLSRRWRAWPRHVVQLAGCLLIAALIQPVLMLLTIVASGLVFVVYRYLDRRRRTLLPVVRERAAQRRSEVTSICLKGPLLESIHSSQEVDERFNEELGNYEREAIRSLASSAWKTPLIIGLSGVLACIFFFIVAVQILRMDSGFTFAGSMTFLLCCIGATVSAIRLERSQRELKSVQTAAEDLRRFLSLPVDALRTKDLKAISRVTKQVVLDHVTLQDSSGRKLLENVSFTFQPGRLIGIVASQRLQAHALVELLMGFGRPTSGRMLLDDVLVTDLEPAAITSLATWVSPTGPLVTASIEGNLLRNGSSNSGDITDAIKGARAFDAVQRLPDGLATVVTSGDDRLIQDVPFRLGIARAALRNRSIVVLEEPENHVDPRTEQETIDAIRSLVRHPTIVVLLPQRLATVRQCDSVILMHEHKIADAGTHGELLQRNELYRHLNYVRFSPLRHVTI